MIKPSTITATLGGILFILGIFVLKAFIPILIGIALLILAFCRGRVAALAFGHFCIVIGAYLITLGLIQLPSYEPTLTYIFFRPLFWGIFSLMGGVCAIFHGFCRCVTKQVDQFEEGRTIATGIESK